MLIICPIGTSRWLWRLTFPSLPDFNLTSTATLPYGPLQLERVSGAPQVTRLSEPWVMFYAKTRAPEGQEASRPARWQEQRLDARAS